MTWTPWLSLYIKERQLSSNYSFGALHSYARPCVNTDRLDCRCVGVLGGVFVCAGYAIRITTRAVEVVSGADQAPGLVAAESSGVKAGLRAKWGGSHLRSRSLKSGKMVPQGSGWVMEGGSGSPYSGTPMSTPAFISSPYTPHTPYTPHLLGSAPPPSSGPPTPGSGMVGLGLAGMPTGSNPASPNPAYLPLPSAPVTGMHTGSHPGSPNPAYLPLPPTPTPGMRQSRSTSPYGVPSPGPPSSHSNGTLHTNGHGSQPQLKRGGPKKDD